MLDALALTPFYQAFLITADVPTIYMQEYYATVSVYKSSIRFTINKKKVSLDVDMFREILQIGPKILGQEFEDLPLEQDILSFIRDLGHTRDVTHLMESICYHHQQEDFLFQNEYKDAKKTNKMSYPGFTKIIIDYFMSKDQFISKRNKMFWHTARDDTELTNQAMLESNAYKTYYAFASGEKTPKLKYVRKKADLDTSPKQKPVQATKGTRLKSKAKVAKSDKKKQPTKKPKAKGLAILSEVALSEDEQLKLATKRNKTQFHSSHASGSGDGVDTQSKVPDEQQQKTSAIDEGTGIIPGVPDVPIYESESEKETWSDSEDEDDENDSDDLSDESDDDNDGNNGNDGDDDDANDDDKQEGTNTNKMFSTVRMLEQEEEDIIKEEVKCSTTLRLLPKQSYLDVMQLPLEVANVTESLEDDVMAWSLSQPQSSYTKDEGAYDGVGDVVCVMDIIMVNVIPPDHVDDVPIVEPNQHDDVPVVPEPVLEDEDEDPKEEEFKEEEEPQEEEDDMEVDIEED
ncbi:hypothetical protein Tco_1532100 [Tanacetum coccineum]